MDAVERALAAMEAKGREDAVRIAADKAREVTLTLDLSFRGDVLKVEVRGIPPFAAVKSVGMTGAPGWTVLGRKHSFDNLAHTYSSHQVQSTEGRCRCRCEGQARPARDEGLGRAP